MGLIHAPTDIGLGQFVSSLNRTQHPFTLKSRIATAHDCGSTVLIVLSLPDAVALGNEPEWTNYAKRCKPPPPLPSHLSPF